MSLASPVRNLSFTEANGVHHLTLIPYYPASNWLAEYFIQILKQGLKKVTQGTLTTCLPKVLFNYRLTPEGTTGISSAQLLLGQRPWSKLDLVRPNTAERVECRQLQQKTHHIVTVDIHNFQEEEEMYLRILAKKRRCCLAALSNVHSSVSFLFCGHDGRTFRRHQGNLWPI